MADSWFRLLEGEAGTPAWVRSTPGRPGLTQTMTMGHSITCTWHSTAGSLFELGMWGSLRIPIPGIQRPMRFWQKHFNEQKITIGSGGSADRGKYSVCIEVGRRPQDLRQPTRRAQIGKWIIRNWIMPGM